MVIPWYIPLKDKKEITVINAFQKILDESNHKPNKIWVNKGSEFYNRSIQHIMKENLFLLKDSLEP